MVTKVLPLSFFGDCLGLFLLRQVVGLEMHAAGLELRLVFLGGPQCLALRQKEVAGKTVLDLDHVAHLAKAADALK